MIAHDCHLLHDHSNHTPKPPGPSTRLEGWSECLQEAQERQERWKMWCLVGTWKTNLHGYLTDPGFPTDTQSRLGTTLQGSSTVGSNVRNLSQQQVSAPFQTFGENNYKRIISFPIAQCCMPYPPWTAARGHGRSQISHTAWGGQWHLMAMTYSVCHQNLSSDIAILGHCYLLCTGNGHKSNCWCSARFGKGLGTAWQGSVDAWTGGRGEENLSFGCNLMIGRSAVKLYSLK